MSTYLLLRSNKESGPYSLEQLIQLGLKPYDLVWVQGKSAAWRYPGEVAELKEHAPMVEEQPFDRFYKRKTDTPEEQTVSVREVNTTEKKPEEKKYVQYMPKKSVSVIMPEQTVAITTDKPAISKVQTAILERTISQELPEVETKYSQPLDEIKEMYVKQLQQRKNKTAQKKFLTKNLKNAAIVILIIGAGFLAGFLINSKKSSNNIALGVSDKKNSTESATVLTKPEETILNNSDSNKIKIDDIIQQDRIRQNNIAAYQPEANQSIIKNDRSEKPRDDKKNETLTNAVVPQQTEINAAGTDLIKNNRSSNSEEESSKKYSSKLSASETEEISKSVSLKSNDYKLKAFGGFQNLELTVSNDSKYALDNVLVELQYLKLSNQPAKVEHIKFQSIAPGGSLTIRIPDNNRGAKLLYKIIKIEPKENTTAGL
ncbi:MAG: hypothetical protein ABUT20_05070 [Bacteroidota bacterium]